MLKKILAVLMALFAAAAFAAVDVNKADATQLDSIKGIGPAIAGKIAAERKKAPFKDWEDFVARVPGIGDKSAAKLSEGGLTVNGAAYKGMVAKPEAKKDSKPAATAVTAAAAPAATARPADSKAAAPAMSAEEKKAAAKKEKDEKAAAAKKAQEDKAAAMKKEKEDKAAAAKAKPVAAKASEPSAKK